jgi:hypothetical protein
MFAMKEYPRDILPLYAQGHSLATFLIAQGGKQKYLKFVGAGLRGDEWGRATSEFYGFENLGALQKSWLDWVRHGSRLPLASSAVGNDAREALTRVGPADAEPGEAGPAPTELGSVELARADPARRPVPEDVEREGMSSQGAGNLVPVRGAAAATKSKGPAPAARAAEQVSIYEGRGRRDTLRR